MLIERAHFFMREAIRLSTEHMRACKGGPFGAVLVQNDQIIARGYNRVLETNDPTAHAEIVALREATQALGRFHLEDCTLFTSCEPCPMCLGAIYWARIPVMYYANTREDAAAIGFDDQFIYEELDRSLPDRRLACYQCLRSEAYTTFQEWANNPNHKLY